MGATVLALLIPQLPFKAYVDVPLFYVASITALVLGGAAAAYGLRERRLLREQRTRWVWLSVSAAICGFWIWFWIVSFSKRVG